MAVEMNLLALPEGCIANTLSLTSPRDACRLSVLASMFHSASQSDAVWERFLPEDYRDIICQSKEGPELLSSFASKKQLYLHLCDHPILLDGATKSFSLEKGSGKKCYMLSAKELSIVWSDTPRYWRWIHLPESRFPTVAELVDVCWLEIHGSIRTSMLSPNTTYSAYLVFTSKSTTYGFQDHTAEASVGVSGQQSQTRAVFLDPQGRASRNLYTVFLRRRSGRFHRHAALRRQQQNAPVDQHAQEPKQRDDGWTEVELGEYFVEEGQDAELDISLLEVKSGGWKSGIIIEGIELRPKGERSDQKMDMQNP